MDHLLLNCEVAGASWDVFFNRFGLSLSYAETSSRLIACWWTVNSAQSSAL